MLSQSYSACPGGTITVPDSPCITDPDARRAAIRALVDKAPPLSPEQLRRLRPYTAPAPLAATA